MNVFFRIDRERLASIMLRLQVLSFVLTIDLIRIDVSIVCYSNVRVEALLKTQFISIVFLLLSTNPVRTGFCTE